MDFISLFPERFLGFFLLFFILPLDIIYMVWWLFKSIGTKQK
jgi:hypothetical protein